MSLRFTGKINTPAARAAALRGAERGLGLALEHLLEESTRIAPIEEGTLIRSANVSQDGLRGVVSYDTPYSVRQHEELDYRHKDNRVAKYLERPFVSERPVLGAIIARSIRDELD